MPHRTLTQSIPAVGDNAALSAPAEAISIDTFQGAGEIAIEVIQRLACARLKNAARKMGERDLRAAPLIQGGG